jgi:hypothetical protein
MSCFRRRWNPWAQATLALGVISAICLAVGSARAQPRDGSKDRREIPFADQTHVFRRVLWDLKCRPVETQDGAFPNLNPKDTILVVLGDTSFLQHFMVGPGPGGTPLDKFLDNGGSVLLATDKPLSLPLASYLLSKTGFWLVNAHFKYGGLDADRRCYRGLPFCPLLVPSEPVPDGCPNLFRNPKNSGGPKLIVATNVPSHLATNPASPLGRNVHELARLPAGIVNEAAPQFRDANTSFMICWQSPRGGRLLFLADHSIFINQMMLPEDNGNVEFAANCINWLGEDGKRKKVLLIEEGIPQSKFNVPIDESHGGGSLEDKAEPVDQINAGIHATNGLLTKVEESDLVNQWIQRFLAKGGGVGVLLVLLTLAGLVAFFGWLVIHGFQQQQPMAPSLARLVQRQVPDESLIEQRNKGMYQVGNLWEIGRLVARQVFEGAGIAAKAGDQVPHVTVKGGWWRRWRVRRQVARLWTLAFASKPLPIAPSDWPTLLRQLDDLRRGLANGSVHLGK